MRERMVEGDGGTYEAILDRRGCGLPERVCHNIILGSMSKTPVREIRGLNP